MLVTKNYSKICGKSGSAHRFSKGGGQNCAIYSISPRRLHGGRRRGKFRILVFKNSGKCIPRLVFKEFCFRATSNSLFSRKVEGPWPIRPPWLHGPCKCIPIFHIFVSVCTLVYRIIVPLLLIFEKFSNPPNYSIPPDYSVQQSISVCNNVFVPV